MEGESLCFDFLIGDGDAFMLPEVLGPALDDERFNVASGRGGVLKQAPSKSAIAAAQPAHELHGLGEIAAILRSNQEFDRHQHWPVLFVAFQH